MRPSLREVFRRLVAEGTISSDDAAKAQRMLAEVAAHDTSAPWYVRVLSAFGAWVASALLVLFLVLAGLADSPGVAVALGAVSIPAACLARARVRHDFLVHLCLATAGVGVGAFAIGAVEMFDLDVRPGAALLALAATSLLVAFPDPVGRFVAAAVTIGSWIVALHAEEPEFANEVLAVVLAAGAVAVWESPVRWSARWAQIRPPLGVALAAGFLALLAWSIADRYDRSGMSSGVASAGLTVVGAVLLWRLFRAQGLAWRSEAFFVSLGAVSILGAICWRTPGLLGAALMAVLGYHRREVVLLVLSGAFVAGFGGWYYYSLELTLLEKSAVLVFSGALLLVARRYVLRRFAPREVKVEVAR